MSRLIDADHFSERLVQASKYWNADKADSHDKGVAQGLLEADEKLGDEHTIQAIPLDRVKQAREEIENEIKFWSEPSKYNVKPIVAIKNAKAQSYKHCLEILDKLIESEE